MNLKFWRTSGASPIVHTYGQNGPSYMRFTVFWFVLAFLFACAACNDTMMEFNPFDSINIFAIFAVLLFIGGVVVVMMEIEATFKHGHHTASVGNRPTPTQYPFMPPSTWMLGLAYLFFGTVGMNLVIVNSIQDIGPMLSVAVSMVYLVVSLVVFVACMMWLRNTLQIDATFRADMSLLTVGSVLGLVIPSFFLIGFFDNFQIFKGTVDWITGLGVTTMGMLLFAHIVIMRRDGVKNTPSPT